jgi:regulator of protease activity HflC (stomatin/prohibitin superfamily)
MGLLMVGPTQSAVVFNTLTGELETPRGPGLHIVIPGIQQTTLYRVSRQEYTMSGHAGEGARSATDDAIAARSIDGQEVFVDVTVIFAIDPVNVNTVHQNWSDASQGYIEGLIRPQVRTIVRDVVATVAAEEIYSSGRETIQSEMKDRAEARLGAEGFTILDVLVREVNFSADFINAIEQRQVAALDRDRASVEAETARIEASGKANARIEEARGEAEATRVQAEAEADALRVVSEQIAANPNLIQYTYITQLSDNVQVVLIPSNSPFLFDPSSFIDVGGDSFVAPENPVFSSSGSSDSSTNSTGSTGSSDTGSGG